MPRRSNIEFQKRCLPHIHLLVWLKNTIRPDDIDNFVSAEIPDPDTDQELHQMVLKHMIHGPCFTHGMLYVAASRTGSGENLTYLTTDGTCMTYNPVYKEIS